MSRKILIGVISIMLVISIFACKNEMKKEKFEFNLSMDELKKTY